MDDMYLPDEADAESDVLFDKKELEPETLRTSKFEASDKIKITFGRFVTLVATRDLKALERNENEEVIISTNLLTDLANAHRTPPNTKGTLMIVAGLFIGVLVGYIIFST